MTTPDVGQASLAVPEPAPELADNAETGTPELPVKARFGRGKRIALGALGVLVLIFAILVAWYAMNRKPLTELPAFTNDKMPHYVFSIYGSERPMGVAVSPAGDRVYVAESDGARLVKIYDRSGKKVGQLTPPKGSTVASRVPVYVTIDPISNDVFVSDRPSKSIQVFDRNGAFKRTFKPLGNLGGGYSPLGLAFDKAGNLYVTDVSATTHRVLVFARDGKLIRTLDTNAKLSFPNGIALDARGTAYVSDSNNGRLMTWDPAGKVVATINRGVGQGDLGLPRGAAIDNSNRLYVVDTSAHVVKVYRLATSNAPAAKYTGSFGEEGQLDGMFEFPNGVATDTRSRIYVTDRENNRVQVWSY